MLPGSPALPDLVLYTRRECSLCDEARALIDALLAERRAAERPVPTVIERDIDSDPGWQRAFFATIPVVELGDRRLEIVTSAARLRRLLADALDADPATTAPTA